MYQRINWKSGFQHRQRIDGFKICKEPIWVRKTLISSKIGRHRTGRDRSHSCALSGRQCLLPSEVSLVKLCLLCTSAAVGGMDVSYYHLCFIPAFWGIIKIQIKMQKIFFFISWTFNNNELSIKIHSIRMYFWIWDGQRFHKQDT